MVAVASIHLAAAQVALTTENRDLVTRLTSTHQKLKLLKAQRAQLEARVQQQDAQVKARCCDSRDMHLSHPLVPHQYRPVK
jgi:hypothetical protein